MTSYLIDTNILIYYLVGAIPDDEKPVIDRVLQEFSLTLFLYCPDFSVFLTG